MTELRIRLDPRRPDLSTFLVGDLLREAVRLNPGRKITMIAPRWMPAVSAAAEGLGFRRRRELCQMGLLIEGTAT